MRQPLYFTYLNNNPNHYSKPTISINSFDQVQVLNPNTLVLCDIDETLLVADIGRNKVVPTDYHGFNRLVERVRNSDGELQFLTARSKHGQYYTQMDFYQIGVDYHKFTVHYTNAGPKGKYILENIKLDGYTDVIFIDDNDSFIHSVKSHHPQIQCYKFHITT